MSSSASTSGEALYPHSMTSLSSACPAAHILDDLGGFHEVPLAGPSSFVRPTSLLFQQAGKQRRWDAVQAHNSVAVALFHTQLQAFILVRQFRPAVYAARWRHATAAGLPQPPPAAGLCYELCAGIMDKAGKTPAQVCCEEVLEEVGYGLQPQQLTPVSSVVSSAGITGSQQAMFFAQVDESLRVCPTGGTMAAQERVEALALPLSAVDAFNADDSLAKTPGCCFGLMWGRQWLQQQRPQ